MTGFGILTNRFAHGFVCAAVIVAAALLLAGCGHAVTDANEPNDDLNSASELSPGIPATGVIGSPDDSDVFAGAAPGGPGSRRFLVTVFSDAPEAIDMQVGANIPGVWEGISWPGWEADESSDRIEVRGELRKGTVLVFLKGSLGTEYSVTISWE